MSRWPRYQVRALRLLGERYEADGWVEIRTYASGERSWESHCKVVGWNSPDLSGAPFPVQVELAAGGEISSRAYVDGPFRLWGDGSTLKVHGTEFGLKMRELGAPDYVVTTRQALLGVVLMPLRILAFLLVTAATIILVVLVFVLVFAPQTFLPDGSGF